METIIEKDANQQALELQLSFERRAQLLTMICKERLAIEHYEPEVKEKIEPGVNEPTFYAAYYHFGHHIHPLNNPIYKYKETGRVSEIALSNCMTQVVYQLSEAKGLNTADENANTDSLYRIRVYYECAKFLSLIHHDGIAIADYIPKISLGHDKKAGKSFCSVAYQHKYFLSRRTADKRWLCESGHENQSIGLLSCMNKILADIVATKVR